MDYININKQRPFDILVVDDTPANLKLLAELLSAQGYHVLPATSGEQALQSIQENKPDLILLDVKMDGLDGYEICQRLKANERTAEIPVIFISALDDEESKVKGFEVGGVDFISKPFRKVEVLSRVKTHLDLHLLQRELKTKNQLLEDEILMHKRAEAALEKRMVAMTQPLEVDAKFEFDVLFNLNEIQKLQDQFATAFGVASIITKPDGTPITQPSNFTRLCQNIIRCTDKGLKNCMYSDAVIGRHNPDGPIVQPCLSGSLWDAGASITIGGYHVANWMIGQVRDEVQQEAKLKAYAHEIGANEKDFMEAFNEIPSMSQVQFQKIAVVLFTMAGQLSDMAYQNMQQAHFISDKKTVLIALAESEERFRTTLYSIGDGVITTDVNGRVMLMNWVAEELTGWKQEEATGKILEEVFNIINEDNRQPVEIPIRKVLREGVVVGLANHTVLIAKNGTERPIADSGAPIRNEKGEIVGVVLVFRDKTEEHIAEKALKTSERKFRSIVESSPMGMYFYELQPNGKLVFDGANPAADKIIGTDHSKYIGKTIQEAFPNLANTNVPSMYSKVATGEIDTQQFEIEYHDVQQINGVYSVTVFQSAENFVTVQFIDISEQKNAELALKVSGERFHGLFEHATVGFSMTQPGGEININPAFANMLGYEPEELKKISWKEITHPDDIQISIDVVELLNSGKQDRFRYDKRYIHKNGTVVWADVSTTLLRDEKGEPLYFITNINDLTQRKEAEAKVQKSEIRFKKLVENSNDMITLIDGSGQMIYSSPSTETILGNRVETLMGNYFTELVHPDDQQTLANLFAKLIQSCEQLHFEPIRVLHSNGNWHWVEGTANNLLADPDINAIVVNYRDITHRKQTEQDLFESEERFRKAITEAPFPIMIHADDDQVIAISRGWTEMSGYEKSDVRTTREWTKLAYGGEQSTVKSYIDSLYGIDHWIDEGEYAILAKYGEQRIWDFSSAPLGQLSDGRRLVISMAKDITERKKAENEILDANQKMDAFFNQSLYGFFFMMLDEPIEWDDQANKDQLLEYVFSNQRITRVNDAWLYQYGATRDQFMGMTPNDMFGHDIQQGKEKWRLLFDNGTLHTESNGFRFNGEPLFVEGDYICLYDSKSRITGHFGVQRDITKNKKTEEDIKKERTLLRTLIDHLPNTVYVKDLEGRKLITNKADVEFIGKSFKEVIRKTDIELFEGETGQHGYDDDMRVMQTGEPMLNVEEHFIDNHGVKRWLVTSKIPLRDSSGKVYGLVGTGRDVTKQHNDYETIQKLSKSIEQSPSTIVITNLNGEIEYVNPKFTEITGYSLEEAIGNNPRILKSGEMSPENYKEMWVTITSGGVWRGEFHNKRKNGELYWEWATITSIKDEVGKIINYIAIKEDISLRKQMENDLIVAKEKAEENDRLKSAFLANMSHEIRTPLNGILGFTELLIDPDVSTEDREEFSKLITKSSHNLLSIVNDILDISKIESGQMQVKKTSFNLHQLIKDLAKQFEQQAAEQGIQLIVDPTIFAHEITLYNDQAKLKQVLLNFITNALKFTPKGSVEIGLHVAEHTIKLYVKDTGIGIPEAHHHNVFERFRQVETSHTRKYGGNGLGLAISKSLIEMLGGTIGLESKPGQGSTFYVELPLMG